MKRHRAQLSNHNPFYLQSRIRPHHDLTILRTNSTQNSWKAIAISIEISPQMEPERSSNQRYLSEGRGAPKSFFKDEGIPIRRPWWCDDKIKNQDLNPGSREHTAEFAVTLYPQIIFVLASIREHQISKSFEEVAGGTMKLNCSIHSEEPWF